jgi:hypothetical protein
LAAFLSPLGLLLQLLLLLSTALPIGLERYGDLANFSSILYFLLPTLENPEATEFDMAVRNDKERRREERAPPHFSHQNQNAKNPREINLFHP